MCHKKFQSLRRVREHSCRDFNTIHNVVSVGGQPQNRMRTRILQLRTADTFGSDNRAKVPFLVQSVVDLLDGGPRSSLLKLAKMPTAQLLPEMHQQFEHFAVFLAVDGVQPGRRGNKKDGKSLDAILTGLRRFFTLVPVCSFQDFWWFVYTDRGKNLNNVVKALLQANYAESTIRNTFYAVQQALPYSQSLVTADAVLAQDTATAELADLMNSVRQLINQSHTRSIVHGDHGRKLRELQEHGQMQDINFPKAMIQYANRQTEKWQARLKTKQRSFNVCQKATVI